MLKTRTLFRLGVGLVVLLFVLFLIVSVWPQDPPTADEIEKRGLQAPPGLKLPASSGSNTDRPATVGTPRDWLDQGLESLAGWHENPLGIRRTYFGEHLSDLKRSKDPKYQEEYQRLMALAQKWRDNLLTRYPELKVQYRNIPDERNALKRLLALQKRLTNPDGSSSLVPPDELRQRLINKKPWDASAAQAWVDANRATLDELRAISRMPESSINDYRGEVYFYLAGGSSLLIDARLAAERGDYAASLESLRAVRGLAAILQGSEAPPLIHQMVGAGMQEKLRNCVFESIMPAIPASEMDLATWESLLKPELQTPADFSRTMKGEWNFATQCYLLPSMADPAETQTPHDSEAFVETYSNHVASIVRQYESIALTDLPTNPDLGFDPSGLSWRSRRLAGEGIGFSYRIGWQRHQLQTGLTQAAFAILKGQPVPNDPIYGKPYTWNPETRQLGLPTGPEFGKMSFRPITLPKLR